MVVSSAYYCPSLTFLMQMVSANYSTMLGRVHYSTVQAVYTFKRYKTARQDNRVLAPSS